MTNAPANTQEDAAGNWSMLVLVLIWLGCLAAFVVLILWPQDRASHVAVAIFATVPAALALTIALQVWHALRHLRDQSATLQATVADLRHAIANSDSKSDPVSPISQSKIDAIAAAQEQTDTRLSLFFSRRGRVDAAIAIPVKDEREPLLALEDASAINLPSPNVAELIRALHFPEDENDTIGFDALRKALADSRTSNLIRAAQEVLTHLAQEGIYMDDLRPDRARPEFWRAFAAGTRGTLIAPLGGIRDRSCLALTAARMRNNPAFKEAAHLFLREFDKVFAAFEKDADDVQIAALSETRSARAFMLMGRVSGVFSR